MLLHIRRVEGASPGGTKTGFPARAWFLRGVERKRFRDLADEPKQPLRVVTTRETRRRPAEARKTGRLAASASPARRL